MKLYSNITGIFIIWVVAILVIFNLGFSTLPHSGKFGGDFWRSFANWDGGHYLGIAESGYSEKFQYAFFPLYPLAVKALNGVAQNYLISAVLISLISAFLGMNLLYKLVAVDFDKKIAEKTIFAALFFPTSFYFLTAYSEGLFFFLVVLTFYLLRKNKLFLATIAAALTSAARPVGLAVVAGFLIEVMITQGLNRKNWFILLSPLGFLIYCIFLYNRTGDPFYFITAENHWQRILVTPGAGFWETLKNIAINGFAPAKFNTTLDLLFAVFGVGFAIRTVRFLPISLVVYSVLSVGIPLFTPTLSSMPRFLLPIFPIFILIALIKNRYVLFAYKIFSSLLLAIFAALFITGYWVS